MRINLENKSADMEGRDINYIFPAYVRSYLFHSKGEMPEKIVFPMYASVNALGADGKLYPVPIEYVPSLDEIAVEIAQDGSNVAEVTPAQEAVLDEKDEEIAALKAKMAELTEPEKASAIPAPEDILRQQEENTQQIEDETADQVLEVATGETVQSAARAAFAKAEAEEQKIEAPAEAAPPTPDREPKLPPGGAIAPGSPLSDSRPRDNKDLVRTARDLMDEPDIKEEEEKEFDKDIKRDEAGKPVVEEKPNEQQVQ